MNESGRSPDQHQYATERNPRLRLLIPLIVAFAFLMEQLDSTIVTTAIPQMARELDTTVLRLNLAITAYVLTLAVFIPVSGWFADRLGARRIFVLALLIFTGSSVLCGMADNLVELVATRCLQGFGGAMMTPVGRLILLRSFPRNQLVTAMFYMSMPALIGPVIGPLLGGFITTYISWRWIFYVNVPFGLLGALLAHRFVENVRAVSSTPFDFSGFLLVGSGLALLQFAIENLGHPVLPATATVAALSAALALLIGFVRHARRMAFPAVDLTLFRLRTFRIGTLAGGVCRIGFNGIPFLLPAMLQVGIGMNPAQSGMLTFSMSFGALLIRPISTRVLRSLGFDRVLLWSAVAGAALIAGFAVIGNATPQWAILIYIALFGFARSTQFLSSNTLSYADVHSESLSRATSLGGALQQLSVSFGVSLSATVLGLVAGRHAALTLADFREVFLVIAIIPLLAVPGFLRLRPQDGAAVSGHSRKKTGGG